MSAQLTVADTGTRAEIVERRGAAVTPLDMLNHAVSSGANIDVLTKLMDLHERWDAARSRKAFDEAISAAKAEIPTITKNREVDFSSSKGRTHYRHEDFAEIARVCTPILAKHGLSYRFRVTSDVGQPITVTCIVSHRDGHSEETTLIAGRDESGNKNSIQAIGSTITYLQRYTLKAALGLAASSDDDGKSAGEDDTYASDEQIAQMRKLISDFDADEAKFCGFLKVERLEDLPASRFQFALKAMNDYGRKARS